MVTVSAFEDGFTALRANPVLFVTGLVVGIGSQLQYADQLIESSLLSAVVSLAWLIAFPFVLGGFIGTARAAIDGGDPSLAHFFGTARTHYVRLLLGTVVFVLLVFGTAVGFALVGFVLGVASAALVAVHETAALAMGAVSLLVWLAGVLGVVTFVQFYEAAIVIEHRSVVESFQRSVELVRSNLGSVVGFSLVWLVSFNAVLLPEYLLQATLTDAGPADVVPIEIPTRVLLPVGVALSAVGFAYLYAVYTAYYLRLIAISSTTPEST
ncbi:hypothetical protein ACFPM1_08025 [Halorubrum rubrum]|uniref:DUF7847 domain-containing protein n=1 Tax=Halorubrum rubrum TaxID=1126240 RepID=A0ABD5R158_9EURY|nr:hypothetical protein [Halorubrum rubrum]